MNNVEGYSQPFHLGLSREGYERINDVATEHLGMGLDVLAAQEPEAAYRLLRAVAFGIIPDSASDANGSFTFDTGRTITTEQDGDAVIGAMTSAIEKSLGSLVLQPIDVKIFIFKTDTDEGGTALEFTVQPPDLAF